MAVKKKVVKKKPKGLKYWITRLDKIFHRAIRMERTDKNGNGKCITCNVPLEFSKTSTGHFQSRSLKNTRWNPENVDVQCNRCNNWLEGQQFKFSLKLGMKKSLELMELSTITWKKTEDEYAELVKYWQERLDKAEATKTFL